MYKFQGATDYIIYEVRLHDWGVYIAQVFMRKFLHMSVSNSWHMEEVA